jgi:hypothetical protein
VSDKTTINRFDVTALYDSFVESAMACPAPEGPWRKPKLVEYVRNQEEWDGITYFTDKMLHLAPHVKSTHKIAILMEPPELLPQIYNIVQHFEEHYDLIFTYATELVESNPEKYIFYPADMAAIEEENCKMHHKTKLVSMIYSNKTELPGHQLRHIIADRFIPAIKYDKIDLYGTGTDSPIKNKSEGCIDYMFQIAIENTSRKSYFADKLLDCFITGCVPIYWGCPNIDEFFDIRGVLTFNSFDELREILENLSEEKYVSMLEYAQNNFNIANENYTCPDDYIYQEVIKRLNT